jgi:hypothetical protein
VPANPFGKTETIRRGRQCQAIALFGFEGAESFFGQCHATRIADPDDFEREVVRLLLHEVITNV